MLNKTDFGGLTQSFITPEIARLAKIERVDNKAGAKAIGRRLHNQAKLAGLAFPYFLPPSYEQVRQYRIRRDMPDREIRKDGTTKEVGKYLGPAGQAPLLYFPPGVTAKMMDELPIVITEGEKKTLALWRLATEKNDGPRFLPIGIAGVWCFRTKIASSDESQAIPDLDRIHWIGRRVTIVFDTNVSTNNGVAAARTALGKELKGRGAEVFFATLPDGQGINGIDDLLGYWEREQGTDPALRAGLDLLANADPFQEPDLKRKQSEQLIDLLEDAELFRTSDGEAYVTIWVNDHEETHRVDSTAIREWLAAQRYKKTRTSPSSNAIREAVDTMSGMAKYEGGRFDVNLRVAEVGGHIYLDLCNDAWEQLRIGQKGISILQSKDSPVKFRRSNGMRPIPAPTSAGDINALRQFLNVDDEGFVLIVGWLLQTLRPGTPFPILIFSGEQGTAKSTTARVLRELIDPNTAPNRSAPTSDRDLLITASNSWICSFDNLASLSCWFSDALCRLSTGGGFATRKLYANDEETILYAKRPIILNGIGEIANRGDLLERALIIRLNPIKPTQRRTEQQFWLEFESAKPGIIGTLVEAVSAGLRNCALVEPPMGLPRMADFVTWVTAAEPGLGFAPGTIRAAYVTNQTRLTETGLAGSALAEYLIAYCDQRLSTKAKFEERILLKDLLSRLKELIHKSSGGSTNGGGFPRSSLHLRNELERLGPGLRSIGLTVRFLGREAGTKRLGASVELIYEPTALAGAAPAEADVVEDDAATLKVEATNVSTEENQNPLVRKEIYAGDDGDVCFADLFMNGEGRRYCPDCGDSELLLVEGGGEGCEICGHQTVARGRKEVVS